MKTEQTTIWAHTDTRLYLSRFVPLPTPAASVAVAICAVALMDALPAMAAATATSLGMDISQHWVLAVFKGSMASAAILAFAPPLAAGVVYTIQSARFAQLPTSRQAAARDAAHAAARSGNRAHVHSDRDDGQTVVVDGPWQTRCSGECDDIIAAGDVMILAPGGWAHEDCGADHPMKPGDGHRYTASAWTSSELWPTRRGG